MNTHRRLLAILIVACLTACGFGEREPEEPPASRGPEAHIEVLSPVNEGTGLAIPLSAGQTVSGSYVMPRGGAVTVFGVRIGNYHGESDGALDLTLCVENECRDATQALQGSQDNDYLPFELGQALAVDEGQPIRYALTRSADSRKQLAIWSYPKLPDQAGLVDPSGTVIERVPKLSIRLD